jgi:hypothetical protein
MKSNKTKKENSMSVRKSLAVFAKSELGKVQSGLSECNGNLADSVSLSGDASFFFEGAELALVAAGVSDQDRAPVSLARAQVDAQLDLYKKQKAFAELDSEISGDE